MPAIKSVAKDAGLFPPDMLDDMIAGYLEETTRDIWFVAVADGQVVGFGYCEPERMTSGTWNLLAIGILASYRGRGIGAAMMRYLENRLAAGGERVGGGGGGCSSRPWARRNTRGPVPSTGPRAMPKRRAYASSTSRAETRLSSGSTSE